MRRGLQSDDPRVLCFTFEFPVSDSAIPRPWFRRLGLVGIYSKLQQIRYPVAPPGCQVVVDLEFVELE